MAFYKRAAPSSAFKYQHRRVMIEFARKLSLRDPENPEHNANAVGLWLQEFIYNFGACSLFGDFVMDGLHKCSFGFEIEGKTYQVVLERTVMRDAELDKL